MRPLWAVAVALALVGCRERPRVHASPPGDRGQTNPATGPRPKRARRGGMDVTFLVVSDAHVGFHYPADLSKLSADPVREPVGLEKDNVALIQRVNAIETHPYPADIGGSVAKPRGLVVTGDLTEWGRKHEWKRFVSLYGQDGKGGLLNIPVYEMAGNHDRNDHGPWLGMQVAKRHGGRHYAWDWDDLHLIALGEAADDDALAFLKRDLAGQAADVPLVVFFHRCLRGPWSEDPAFDEAHKQRLARALEGRNVAAIFHGHHHARGHYVWEGHDVYKPGAVKDGAHSVAVVHATDAHWTVASYDWDKDAWGPVHRKALPKAATGAAPRGD